MRKDDLRHVLYKSKLNMITTDVTWEDIHNKLTDLGIVLNYRGEYTDYLDTPFIYIGDDWSVDYGVSIQEYRKSTYVSIDIKELMGVNIVSDYEAGLEDMDMAARKIVSEVIDGKFLKEQLQIGYDWEDDPAADTNKLLEKIEKEIHQKLTTKQLELKHKEL